MSRIRWHHLRVAGEHVYAANIGDRLCTITSRERGLFWDVAFMRGAREWIHGTYASKRIAMSVCRERVR